MGGAGVMIKPFALVALLFVPGLANAQSGTVSLLGTQITPMCWVGDFFNNCPSGGAPGHSSTGDVDLDRAVKICDAHALHGDGVVMTIPDWPHWSKDYAGCHDIIARWNASDTARREAEARQREDADRAWLAEYAKGAKP